MMLKSPGAAAFGLFALLSLLAAALAAPLMAQAGEGEEASVDRGSLAAAAAIRSRLIVGPGKPFTLREVSALQPRSRTPAPLNLGEVLGKKPLVLFYMKLGHGISEEIYLETQEYVDSLLKDKVTLYPVVFLGKRFEVTELYERMQILGINRPVIMDEDQRMQFALNMYYAPHIALIHSDGNLAFSGARSLRHPVYGEMDAAEAIAISASGERPPSRELWKYYPANDLLGRKFSDVTLPAYDTGKSMRISDFVEPGKLTAIFYWSPTCKYSRGVMPTLAVALKTFSPKYLNLVTVVRDGRREEIRQVASDTGLGAPILRNRDKRFTTRYRVMSTPTLILIRPDGVIDSVYTSGKINLFPVLSIKIKKLIIDPAAPSSAAPSSG